MKFEWQKVMKYELDKSYQTDLFPIKEEDILLALVPIDSQRLEKHITTEQCEQLETMRTLLLTKSDSKIEDDIVLEEGSIAVLFEKNNIKSTYDPKQTGLNLAMWLNSMAPLENHQLAICSSKSFFWEYVVEDYCPNLAIEFQFTVAVKIEYFTEIIDSWLRRQNLLHICEVNEVFDTYLTSINFTGAVASYNTDEIIDNHFVQRKLQQKLGKSLHFFHSYGLEVKIEDIVWRTKQAAKEPKEGFTAKIEKNRKESPIDDLRYDQISIKKMTEE